METLLAPPRTEYVPLAEQVIPGNVPPDDEKVGGSGPPPEPLQGGTDSADSELEERTGNEGAGT